MKFNSMIPELLVSDLEKSLGFYIGVLGFKMEYERRESGFVFLSFEGSQLMLEQKNGKWRTKKLEYPFGRGINLQIETKNIQRLVQSLQKHNYPIKELPKENWYRMNKKLLGQKEFLVMDPDGYLLRFAQNIGTKAVE